ncbi:NmrA-like family protein [Aspergillus saccharolyticus JOP 1030-1]|uniref:NmrA-like family protein n=1 Tax=Aspergillus saccharolyticus JOP 1030-1 TaxID=1450539 RepID=A0A318Z5C2_9EURO|nr:NmrA-like family protein [Aspergillus saccharolyticus JOP 1030-1]PYH42511.1 NmrA-like family protein [Aspergillus saccharolyticus JOP 1030-1]
MSTKTICIVGITGNQGSSVARRFLQDPNFQVRGLTRNPNTPAAQSLVTQGVQLITADLNDPNTIIPAFQGANIIFSVTNYWEPFFRPEDRQRALTAGISCREHAYRVELQQGKNIADAAAQTVDSLDENGLIVSTLSHAKQCSRGRFQELYHFDAKAEVFPGYVREMHPRLAEKMSCVQTGYFNSSYRLVPEAYFRKCHTESGAEMFEMTFTTSPDAVIPHLAVQSDLGGFVYAVSKMPPGRSYMACGTKSSWTEYMRIWGETNAVAARYRQIPLHEFIDQVSDPEFGREVGDMFSYSSDPGYDGGDHTLLTAEDMRRAGIECPMTSLEEWIRKEDWSSVL